MDFRKKCTSIKGKILKLHHESNVILILADKVLKVLIGGGKGAPALNSLKQNSFW